MHSSKFFANIKMTTLPKHFIKKSNQKDEKSKSVSEIPTVIEDTKEEQEFFRPQVIHLKHLLPQTDNSELQPPSTPKKLTKSSSLSALAKISEDFFFEEDVSGKDRTFCGNFNRTINKLASKFPHIVPQIDLIEDHTTSGGYKSRDISPSPIKESEEEMKEEGGRRKEEEGGNEMENEELKREGGRREEGVGGGRKKIVVVDEIDKIWVEKRVEGRVKAILEEENEGGQEGKLEEMVGKRMKEERDFWNKIMKSGDLLKADNYIKEIVGLEYVNLKMKDVEIVESSQESEY